MEINNAKIKNVTVGLDDRNRLSASMSFENQHGSYEWVCILTNPTDAERLLKLMSYTDTYEVNNLNGKIVRVVNHDGVLHGFGNPIEDKFVHIFMEELKEVTEAQFEELPETK